MRLVVLRVRASSLRKLSSGIRLRPCWPSPRVEPGRKGPQGRRRLVDSRQAVVIRRNLASLGGGGGVVVGWVGFIAGGVRVLWVARW
ncbi:MAG: hypothetical protein RI897_3395 [Verrucomicrobiota bacterium]